MKLLMFIFTMDRPMQLEAFLRSMKKHYKNLDETQVVVYYNYSHADYIRAYDGVMKKYSKFRWIKEEDITKDIRKVFNEYKDIPYATFFCDDNIWKDTFDLNHNDFKWFEANPNVVCYSLRLHPRIKKCYSAGNIDTPPPENLYANIKAFIWKWTDPSLKGDWCYPMSIDGHIFRMGVIKQYVDNVKYDNVNHVEAFFAAKPPKQLPYMVCSQTSAIMNIPLNRVQTSSPNIHMHINPLGLNKQFLKGKRIDVDALEGFENVSPHQEIGIRLV